MSLSSPPSFPTLSRNTTLDNIKGVLIFLVVFGHFIEVHISNDAFLRPIWVFVYAFHMPMFALVSGIFSKAYLDETQSLQLIKNIVAPLLGMECIYELTEYALQGSMSVYAGLVAPYWMLWYLLSLLCWRLLLPLFARLQFPVLLAVVLALLGSYSAQAGYFLSGARTLMFFPYFLLGYSLGTNWLRNYKQVYLIAALAIAALAALAVTLLPDNFDYRWLYGSFSLQRLGMANVHGTLYQLLQFAVSTTLGLAMLYLLARRDLGLARIGRQSMYVFLWHGMALIILQHYGILSQILHMEAATRLCLSLAASAAIVWLTAHPYCERITQIVILRPLSWLLLRASANRADPLGLAKETVQPK
ncbi:MULTISPECIES: acyltransferase family protein [unclassified Undibacterium]|uniref:acyltransferase family protein n=1 Tax=unclassified Undibacterium TaxID=2630295 RepID=UPI002AC90C5E|nr:MULTISPECIES: acyltransferase family protein [unclassified Undibacterium]MEB0138189.1 acyltransferase family protein [Undibacterium sp. CCC2.1]MEB0171056.1 acyltransferase family protein [Undibacterium sp. CCC1.1]MEB0175101.1 acyltransferase family protein [Undibacterium sp. CCC3.4]MEB0214315.1 acyltransferase family protein [Undibacterium sp. 5I2]WPX41896.1 acyltransferase family protein [Undibacterium sp. CCC3.4]